MEDLELKTTATRPNEQLAGTDPPPPHHHPPPPHHHHCSMFDDSNSSSSHRTMIMDEKIDAGSVIDIENFTLDLQNHCRVYRSKLDAWVDDQMVRCHAAVERHNASAALHQSRIDQTMQTLLAWQLQDGLTINNNNNSNNNKSNSNNTNEKNKQRETLRQKQIQVQDELDGLQVQLDEKKTHLQGT
jgi:hypothetical protein